MAAAFHHIMDYVKNPEKTDDGRLVETYQCDKDRADAEFTIAKSLYHNITGRRSEHDKVLAYMIRQSFLPGEITPEKALELGTRLAMEFTGGKHQFVVCCHTDKDHIHTHIVFNAVTLDYGQKFQNYKDSAAKVRELSDAMCRENGLFKEQYRAAHETEILLHEAAKRAFDALGVKKLPSVAALQAEYAELAEKKKALYAEYTRLKGEARELATVKQNVDRLLNATMDEPNRARNLAR